MYKGLYESDPDYDNNKRQIDETDQQKTQLYN